VAFRQPQIWRSGGFVAKRQRPVSRSDRSGAFRQEGGVKPPEARPASWDAELWTARWEFDKDPGTFFSALDILRERGAPFRVSVLGESFRRVPAVFARGEGLY
jgi:hypothetical protein